MALLKDIPVKGLLFQMVKYLSSARAGLSSQEKHFYIADARLEAMRVKIEALESKGFFGKKKPKQDDTKIRWLNT